MAIRPIHIYPDPVLRRRCEEVERFDDDLRELAGDMVATMHAAPGIGLAAPQVGDGRRLAVVDLSVGEDPAAAPRLRQPAHPRQRRARVRRRGVPVDPRASANRVDRPRAIRVAAEDLDGQHLRAGRRRLAGAGDLPRDGPPRRRPVHRPSPRPPARAGAAPAQEAGARGRSGGGAGVKRRRRSAVATCALGLVATAGLGVVGGGGGGGSPRRRPPRRPASPSPTSPAAPPT